MTCVESLVAVAVIACPTLTAVVGENVNERIPSTVVVIVFSPTNVLPSFVSAGFA